MRQILVILLLLGAIVGLAFWYYRAEFHPEIPVEVTVEKIEGSARRADGSAGAQPLKEGDRLVEGSRIKTEKGGVVRLGVEKGEQVDLMDDSELVIGQVSSEGVNFELKQGRLEANVKRFRDHERTVSVGVADNPARVRTHEGSFSVVADGWGTMDVAAQAGNVELVGGAGKAPEPIPVGERRVIGADGDKLLSGQVPRSVLLKVDWPDGGVRRQKSIEVSGSVTPGSRVSVAGQVVRPGKDGKFKSVVPLQEGKNRIDVEATGMGAPVKTTSPELTVDTRPPRLDAKTDGIWK